MVRHLGIAATLTAALACGQLPAIAGIVEISIPAFSQSPLSRPAYDSVWDAVAPVGSTLDVNSGIGIIVNPSYVAANDNHDFAMHQNPALGSPAYVANFVPDPLYNTITYLFDHPTIVRGVEIIQHTNGVTQLTGMLGNSPGSLQTIGPVFGPSGDVLNSSVVPSDGVSQVFDFGNTGISGTMFQLIISKSSHASAYAFHRAYLLDENNARIGLSPGTASSVPEPATGTLAGSVALIALLYRRRRRRTRIQ